MNSKNIYSFVDSRTVKQKRLDTKEAMIKRSFYGNINYEQVYKNGSQSNTLDCWIYDDKSERKDGELKFIQPHPDQELSRGDYIHWDGGIWLVRGINPQYDMATIGMMYKCLEVKFRWVDELGLHDIPFFAQSKVLRDPLLDNSKLYLVDDSMEAYVQKNEETARIIENMRFVFGARTSFKVIEVVDYYIENIIKIILKKDEQVEQDDFVNHIAYNNRYQFLIEPKEPEEVKGNIGEQYQLNSILYYNDEKYTVNSVWISSDESVATVSQTGLVTFLSHGTSTITATYNGLTDTSVVTCDIVLDNQTYILTPETVNKIILNRTETFNIIKIDNGIEVVLNSSITCDKTGEFIFTVIDNNNFSIENIRETNLDIVITIEDLDNSKTVEKILKLRAW